MKPEIKTLEQLRNRADNLTDESGYFLIESKEWDIKWISLDSLKEMDLYREMCNKFGKVEIWGLNTDELLGKVEELIRSWD